MFKILFLLLLLCGDILNASYLENAHKALLSQNISKAIQLYKLSAREGVDEANFQLGKIYYMQKYNHRDFNKAFEYFKKAADYGHQKAKYNLAIIYSQKRFKKHNFKRAYELFLSLAKHGQSNAQYRVGIALLYGLGVKKDYSLSKRWFEESYFENNYKRAACPIAFIYANGLGVIQNLGRARKFSEPFLNKYPLCTKVFEEFKLFKNKYKKDKGFKLGYYK